MKRWVITGILVAAIGVGCSLDTKSPVVRFFFEVPDEQTDASTGGDATATAPVDQVSRESDAHPAGRTFRSVHQPFLVRQCASCHDTGRQMSVRADAMDACRACHVRYFSKEVGHPPVQKGHCHKCHEPHRSREPFLLNQPLFDACMECHDPPEKLSRPAHSGENVRNCTACHDPHFGEGMRLKPTAPWPTEKR